MHPEADAFLDAIFDNPDDDTIRLVYADWLEEHGQGNYAQFIRLQCAAAGEKLWGDEANRLWEEIGRVWTKLDEEWRPAAWDWWRFVGWWGSLDAVHFERGFPPPNLAVTDEQFVRFSQGDVWLPWLFPPRCTLLLTSVGKWEQLALVPQLRRVTELRLDSSEHSWELAQGTLPKEICDLLNSPHLSNVHLLDLSDLLLSQYAVKVLLTAQNLASVQRLGVELSRERGPDPDETVKQLQTRFKYVEWVNDWDSE